MSQFMPTLCWDCKNYMNGCSWAREGKPVEGWTAIPTVKQQHNHDPLHSFLVLKCPEFEADAEDGGTRRIGEKRDGRNRRTASGHERDTLHHRIGTDPDADI